jgi:hypothetical protein
VPADDEDVRDEEVAWDKAAVRNWNVISNASENDLRAELAERHSARLDATGSPVSSARAKDSDSEPQHLALVTEPEGATRYAVSPSLFQTFCRFQITSPGDSTASSPVKITSRALASIEPNWLSMVEWRDSSSWSSYPASEIAFPVGFSRTTRSSRFWH